MRAPCWTLNHATEGIGRTYPQHQEMGSGYDYDAPNSVHQLPFDSLPDFEPDFNTVIVHPQAKLTDLISSAPIRCTGYLISSRLRTLLEQFVLPLHRFYSVPMLHRDKTVAGYSWLQLPQPKVQLTADSSPAEAESAISRDPELAMCDLLRLYQPSRFAYCFISDPLRQALESAAITGLRFGTAKLFRSSGS